MECIRILVIYECLIILIGKYSLIYKKFMGHKEPNIYSYPNKNI